MAYSKMTTEILQEKFDISIHFNTIFAGYLPQKPTNWLEDTLKMAVKTPLASEKERSERIVSPILIALREMNDNKIGVYSGVNLDADKKNGLVGECDFILTNMPANYYLEPPILAITEAKKNDIELGIPQCIAQMIGAQIYNNKKGKLIKNVYGCVTTGEIWQFLVLTDRQVSIHTQRYGILQIADILGILQYIVNENT
jgi:hypothetical protein